MQQLVVRGGKALEGTIRISGAKNAALPLMITTLLTDEGVRLHNVPDLIDTKILLTLLQRHGTNSTITDEVSGNFTLSLQTPSIMCDSTPYHLVRAMRASILVLGPMLARRGFAKVSLPGGCAIGARPVDLHIKVLEAMQAKITLEDGYIVAAAKQGLKGADFTFPIVSVGATANAIMAATLAQGVTVLHNAAKEPEIIDLAKCLNAMNAKIRGAGTDTITIEGVAKLSATTHNVLPDRIEAGSFACMVATCGGYLTLQGIDPNLLRVPLNLLQRIGVKVDVGDNTIHIKGKALHAVDITTNPYPAFPTDLQAQFMATLCLVKGSSTINETIFENRFMHVPELVRLGANITHKGNIATVKGVDTLHGVEVTATDLRASMGLVIAGLQAKGTTTINNIHHLDRGYTLLENKISKVGGRIERISHA